MAAARHATGEAFLNLFLTGFLYSMVWHVRVGYNKNKTNK